MNNQISISYCITVCTELNELTNLVNFLHPKLETDDEILIQYDTDTVSKPVLDYITILKSLHSNIIVVDYALNNDFAAFKNNLKTHANGIYIFQIDADEIPNEVLVENMHILLEDNKEVDLFFVPRINTVDGITEEYIKKWGWQVSKMETQIGEKVIDTTSDEYKFLKTNDFIIDEVDNKVKYYKPIIQFPDVQTRIYRRTSEIEWVGKVHERIKGYNTLTLLPFEEEYCLYHHKKLEKQKQQNEFYETIN